MKRTTIELSEETYAASKAEAEKDRRPWTHELAVLIEEALAARAKKAKAA